MFFNGKPISHKSAKALETLTNRTICVLTPTGIRNMNQYDDYRADLVLIDQHFRQGSIDNPIDNSVVAVGEHCRYIPIDIVPRGVWD